MPEYRRKKQYSGIKKPRNMNVPRYWQIISTIYKITDFEWVPITLLLASLVISILRIKQDLHQFCHTL